VISELRTLIPSAGREGEKMAELDLLSAAVGAGLAAVGALLSNRWRDSLQRSDEMRSVAAVLYGEVLLLRDELGLTARIVARLRVDGADISRRIAEDYMPTEPVIYPAVASRIGLLPPQWVLAITAFHQRYETVRRYLPLIVETEIDSYIRSGQVVPLPERTRLPYGVTAVLAPAQEAVHEIKPTLRAIEDLLGVVRAADPDLGYTDGVIETDRLNAEAQS